MKAIEDLEKEYEGFTKKSTAVTNLEEFLAFIDIEIDDYKYAEKDFKRELRENARWKLEAQIRNFFFFIFEEEEVDLYDLDTEIVLQCVTLVQKMEEYFRRIRGVATESNFGPLTKLVDFSNDQYYVQRDYYDYERDQLEFSARGIRMFNPKFEDRREALLEFLEKRVRKLEESSKKEPPVQYVKERK